MNEISYPPPKDYYFTFIDTIDRFYITSNFNSNVQLIVEIVLNDIFKKEKERFLLNILKKLKEKE